MSGDDPRRHRRHKIRIAIELGASGRLEDWVAEDVSPGGRQVGAQLPLQQGELVRVRFRPDRLSHQPGGAATVAWATRDPPHRVGLRHSGSTERADAELPAVLARPRATPHPESLR